nr:P-loop NTPase fold protein [Salinibacter ruber]
METEERDKLGYWEYGKRIATALEGAPNQEGIVASINGPWGTGKSTLLRFVRQNIDEFNLFTFNPWWFASQEDLTRRFLNQLGSDLITQGALYDETARNAFMQYTKAVGGAAKMIPGGMGIGKGFETIAEAFEGLTNIRALKSSVADSLKKAGPRLVLIDEIDRLTRDQMRSVFQLVRSIADFPKTSYLLAFDRELVADALSEEQGVSGNQYLEKIIEVPFDIPVPDSAALRDVLEDYLHPAFQSAEGPFDLDYWNSVYQNGMDRCIRNIRDVKRLTNALALTYPSVSEHVNATDITALELLRIRFPDVYDYVRRNKQEFVRSRSAIQKARRVGEQRERRQKHDNWAGLVEERDQDSVEALLISIFPLVKAELRETNYERQFDDWKTRRRACHPDFFEEYFRFEPRPSGLSNKKYRRALRELDTSAAFCARLRELKRDLPVRQENTIHLFLDRFIEEDVWKDEDVPYLDAIQSLVDASPLVLGLNQRRDESDHSNARLLARAIIRIRDEWQEEEQGDIDDEQIIEMIGEASMELLTATYMVEDEQGPTDFSDALRSGFTRRVRNPDLMNLLESEEIDLTLELIEKKYGLEEVHDIIRPQIQDSHGLAIFLKRLTKPRFGEGGQEQRIDGRQLARWLGPAFDRTIDRIQDLISEQGWGDQLLNKALRDFLDRYEEDEEEYRRFLPDESN